MRARAVQDLPQLSDGDFFEAVAEGLGVVIKNAGRLNEAAVVLDDVGHFHAARVLNAIAEEEAAKVMILLDAVRCPRIPGKRFSKQLARFNDHMAKGLYARSCMMRPSTLRQLQEYVDHFRDEFYLDGMTGAEWIFRNEIQQGREGLLYVDYVSTDEGHHHWADPAQFEDLMRGGPTEPLALKMAKALFAVGLSTGSALKIAAEAWRPTAIEPDTRWVEIRSRNHQTLEALESAQLLQLQPHETYSWVIDQWQFPMYDLDLGLIPVNVESLRERQRNWSPEW